MKLLLGWIILGSLFLFAQVDFSWNSWKLFRKISLRILICVSDADFWITIFFFMFSLKLIICIGTCLLIIQVLSFSPKTRSICLVSSCHILWNWNTLLKQRVLDFLHLLPINSPIVCCRFHGNFTCFVSLCQNRLYFCLLKLIFGNVLGLMSSMHQLRNHLWACPILI